jgi:hypothetical protein
MVLTENVAWIASQKEHGLMAHRRLSVEQQLKGVRAALNSRRTPKHLKRGLKKREKKLRKRIKKNDSLWDSGWLGT